MNIIQKACANFRTGRQNHKPLGVVIHIMSSSLGSADNTFANPTSMVSAHYGVGKNGEIHQYVPEESTAWHAGKANGATFPFMQSGVNTNLYTVGIEHEGKENDTWPDAQKNASAALIKSICTKWGIPIDRNHIVGHYQVNGSPMKAHCPAVDKSIIDELVALAKVANP